MRHTRGFTVLAMAVLAFWVIGTGPSQALAGGSKFSVHVSTGGFGFHCGSHGRHRGHYGGRYYGHHGGHRSYGHRGYHSSYSHYYYPRHHSYSYSYGYRPSVTYYGHSYPPATRVYVPYPVQRETHAYVAPPAVTPPAGQGSPGRSTGENGWTLLGEGRYEQALRQFGHESQLNPQRGEPKVGYALSSALAGRLERGVWAMRRAFSTDPHGVHYVSIDEKLRPSVQKLAGHYGYAEGQGPSDGPFMAAALHFLVRENEAAHDAITAAVAAGDRKSSTLNLQRLIEDEVRGQVPAKAPASAPVGEQPFIEKVY